VVWTAINEPVTLLLLQHPTVQLCCWAGCVVYDFLRCRWPMMSVCKQTMQNQWQHSTCLYLQAQVKHDILQMCCISNGICSIVINATKMKHLNTILLWGIPCDLPRPPTSSDRNESLHGGWSSGGSSEVWISSKSIKQFRSCGVKLCPFPLIWPNQWESSQINGKGKFQWPLTYVVTACKLFIPSRVL